MRMAVILISLLLFFTSWGYPEEVETCTVRTYGNYTKSTCYRRYKKCRAKENTKQRKRKRQQWHIDVKRELNEKVKLRKYRAGL